MGFPTALPLEEGALRSPLSIYLQSQGAAPLGEKKGYSCTNSRTRARNIFRLTNKRG